MDFFAKTRVRLTLIYSLLFAVVAVSAAGAFIVGLYESEQSTVDTSLRLQSSAVAAIFAEAHRSGEPSQALPPQTGTEIQVYVFDRDRQFVEATTADPGAATIWKPSRSPQLSQLSTRQVSGVSYRVLITPVALPDGSRGYLVVTRPVDETRAGLEQTALMLALVVLVLVTAAGLLAYWLAGRALTPARAMSLSLQRFTADAAHELRAPLALLRTRIEITLRQRRSPDQYQESHRQLLAEVERLSRLTDQLLVLARADAGALKAALQPVDLPDLLEEIVARWRPRFAEQQIRLTADLPAEGGVQADADLLIRLLDNLLDNALRYARPRGSVLFRVSREGADWRLLVNDDGPGIDPALRPRLFERFFREDSARGRETGGAGLGLAISQAIARVHGGSLELASGAPLRGAAFLLRLPASRLAARPSVGQASLDASA